MVFNSISGKCFLPSNTSIVKEAYFVTLFFEKYRKILLNHKDVLFA